MDTLKRGGVSSAEAVVLGALTSGVNKPTWSMIKISFLMLGLCLAGMLVLAFSSSDFVIIGHVMLLVLIGSLLFIFLNRFLAEIGLVPVQQQMEEMGLSKSQHVELEKRE